MKKRVLSCMLASMMIIAGMTGCGQATSGGTQESKESVPESKQSTDVGGSTSEQGAAADMYQTTYGSQIFDDVTITVELFDRSNAPEGSTITDNKWVKYVNEQMNKVGITVEFVPVPRWDEVTKMQAMMASQTSPDITLTYTYALAEDYFKQGGTWDLSEFIDGEGQAENLKAYLGKDVIDIGRNPENQLYGIVARRATTATSNLFVRKDWLDALDLPLPSTTDELYNAIYEMVNNNPDGRKDVIGAIVWNSWNLKIAFSKLAGNQKEMDIAAGDSAISDYYDPGAREYFRFVNKLYNAGLMHQEYYTLSEDDFKTQVVNGAVGFFEYNVNGAVDVLRGSLLKTLQENVASADIVSIPALANVNDGKQYSEAYSAGGLIAFCPLTADAEKVEACMTYLDWMSTQEGGFVLYHGFEGEHFDFDGNGVPVVKDAEYNSQDKDWLRTDIFIVGNQGYFATEEDFNACTSKEAPGYEQYVIDNYENALSGIIVHDPTYSSPSAPDLTTDIDLAKDEYRVSCVTCSEADFDATFDEYMKKLEEIGIQTIIDERTKYFNEQYAN